ncbi:MAG: hypothetical protein QM726_23625 [Chitinophagaceae bacterium]
MRISLFLVYCMLLQLINAEAQVLPQSIRTILPEKGIYRYQTFNEGSIVFRNGIISAGKMNYNVSLDEMHFITSSGDTLSVADPASISFVNLNGSRFYYDKGFYQTIDTIRANGIVLAYRQSFSEQQQRKYGAYDITEQHEGLRTMTFYTGHGQIYKLGADEKVMITTKEHYFFGDVYGHFEKAQKQFILHHFKKQESVLNEFIKTNHINFNEPEDLLKLMQFCGTLQ